MSAPDSKVENVPEEVGLRFALPATAENVAIVRHAVGGLAETLGMDPTSVADLKTVVTEACTNVAVHAYGEESGPLEVEIHPDEEGITVVVRDHGAGIRPRPDIDGSRLRLGLPLIAALASEFSISGGIGRGTEVVMRMQMAAAPLEETEVTVPAGTLHGTAIEVADERVVGAVVGRVLSVIAARSDFPMDRLTDAMLIADALAAGASEGFDDGRIKLLVEDGDGSLDLRLGPMRDGAAQRLRSELEIPGLGATLEQLADDVRVDQDGRGEYFTLKMNAARP